MSSIVGPPGGLITAPIPANATPDEVAKANALLLAFRENMISRGIPADVIDGALARAMQAMLSGSSLDAAVAEGENFINAAKKQRRGDVGGTMPPPPKMVAMEAIKGNFCITGSDGKPLSSWASYVCRNKDAIKAEYAVQLAQWKAACVPGAFFKAAKLYAAKHGNFKFQTKAEKDAAKALSIAKLKMRPKTKRTAEQKALAKIRREAKRCKILTACRTKSVSCGKKKKSCPKKKKKCPTKKRKSGVTKATLLKVIQSMGKKIGKKRCSPKKKKACPKKKKACKGMSKAALIRALMKK